jgi:hypothetical protein
LQSVPSKKLRRSSLMPWRKQRTLNIRPWGARLVRAVCASISCTSPCACIRPLHNYMYSFKPGCKFKF